MLIAILLSEVFFIVMLSAVMAIVVMLNVMAFIKNPEKCEKTGTKFGHLQIVSKDLIIGLIS